MVKIHIPRAALAVAVLIVAMVPGWPARASFPGSNGVLVFQRELPAGDHTQADIYTMRADGSCLRRLTTTRGLNEFGPVWNAAGTRIAFWRTTAPFGPGSIWTVAADGSDLRRLTSGFDARDPAWSPNGVRIVFTRVDATGWHLWTMNAADGAKLRRFTTGPALDFEPSWSPDGTRIAFTRGFADGDVGDIYLLSQSTGAVTRVTDSAGYDHQVAWAPGSRRLVFERDGQTSSSIYLVGAGGARLTRLTRGPYFDTGPVLAPDGRFIAFGSDRGPGFLDDLWLIRPDGTAAHDLRVLRYSEGIPDWQALP